MTSKNKRICINCPTKLVGQQRKFCSPGCAIMYYYNNEPKAKEREKKINIYINNGRRTCFANQKIKQSNTKIQRLNEIMKKLIRDINKTSNLLDVEHERHKIYIETKEKIIEDNKKR